MKKRHDFPFTILAAAGLLALAPPLAAQAIVNAPVSPEAIYIGAGGTSAGVSVIDMNGFGQGTGVLANSNFGKNPNVGRPGVYPPLALGTTNFDAGGEGAMTLTRDSTGSTRLLPTGRVGDMQLGHPLDRIFNDTNINANVNAANQINPVTGTPQPGNTIMVAPHPNPPRLVYPPPNPLMGIFAEEPTVTSAGPPFLQGVIMTQSPPCLRSALNLLAKGDPFSTTRPGLFDTNFEYVFFGPQPPPPAPPPPPAYCPYTSRQQIGHFLYVLDRDNKQVLAVNSNRMTILQRIPLPDPIRMAISPNLRWLAVSNYSTDTVSFVDVAPGSPTFHRVVATTAVGRGPSELAWQPEGEDLFVCNTLGNSVTIISGATLKVRHDIQKSVSAPIGVAVTARQVGIGFDTNTYFAYILNAAGSVAVYESGPDRIGLNDVTAAPSILFVDATAIQPDVAHPGSAVWIAHRDFFGLAQVSRLELTTSPQGPQLNVAGGDDSALPQPRGRAWTVTARIGGTNPTTPIKDLLTGRQPIDIAFDDIRNNGAWPDVGSLVVPGLAYATHSGKGHRKMTPQGTVPAALPRFIAVACRDSGTVDLVEIDTGRRFATLSTPDVTSLCHYWRQ